MPVPVSPISPDSITPPQPFHRPYPQLYPSTYPTNQSIANLPAYPAMYRNQPSLQIQNSFIPLNTQENDKDYHPPPSYPIVEYSKNATLLSGNIVINTTDSIPDGYLICDGSNVSRVVYSNLFKAVGTYYGVGDRQNTFSLPNLQDDNNTTHYIIKI
jgi:hypothetical protein